MDLQHFRQHVLLYWAGSPLQLQQPNRLYRRMRVGAAQRELSRDQGNLFLYPGDSLVPHLDWTNCFSNTILPVGTHFWYKARDHHWWLGKISAHTTTTAIYIVRFRTIPDQSRSSSVLPAILQLSGRAATPGAPKLA